MSVSQMSVDQMSVDQMSVDQMSVDQMSVDQMSVGQMIFDQKTRILQNFDHYTRHVGLHMPTNYSFFIIGSFVETQNNELIKIYNKRLVL